MLQISVVYPVCIILSLIILNCSKASQFTWDSKLPLNNSWQRAPSWFLWQFRDITRLVNKNWVFKVFHWWITLGNNRLGAPGGVEPRCPLRCSPEEDLEWLQSNAAPRLSLAQPQERQSARKRGGRKKKERIWGSARLTKTSDQRKPENKLPIFSNQQDSLKKRTLSLFAKGRWSY